jgi:soluble lytic murein transglycosylase-like protein
MLFLLGLVPIAFIIHSWMFVQINNKFNSFSKQTENLDKALAVSVQSTELRAAALELEYTNTVSRIRVLEDSVDAQTIRWGKVKQVRDAIKKISTHNLHVSESTEIASAVVDYSEEYDVSASLILAVIRQESNFNNKAESHKAAQGLMQIMPSTAADIKLWLGTKYYNPWKSRHNIRFGTFYLARMLYQFDNNEQLAIAAYNAGPTTVERVRNGDWENYRQETIDYLNRIPQWKKQFETQGITW